MTETITKTGYSAKKDFSLYFLILTNLAIGIWLLNSGVKLTTAYFIYLTQNFILSIFTILRLHFVKYENIYVNKSTDIDNEEYSIEEESLLESGESSKWVFIFKSSLATIFNHIMAFVAIASFWLTIPIMNSPVASEITTRNLPQDDIAFGVISAFFVTSLINFLIHVVQTKLGDNVKVNLSDSITISLIVPLVLIMVASFSIFLPSSVRDFLGLLSLILLKLFFDTTLHINEQYRFLGRSD